MVEFLFKRARGDASHQRGLLFNVETQEYCEVEELGSGAFKQAYYCPGSNTVFVLINSDLPDTALKVLSTITSASRRDSRPLNIHLPPVEELGWIEPSQLPDPGWRGDSSRMLMGSPAGLDVYEMPLYQVPPKFTSAGYGLGIGYWQMAILQKLREDILNYSSFPTTEMITWLPDRFNDLVYLADPQEGDLSFGEIGQVIIDDWGWGGEALGQPQTTQALEYCQKRMTQSSSIQTPYTPDQIFSQELNEALFHLNTWALSFDEEENWMLEFPPQNMGSDMDGNLVLFDVLFNRGDLKIVRRTGISPNVFTRPYYQTPKRLRKNTQEDSYLLRS